MSNAWGNKKIHGIIRSSRASGKDPGKSNGREIFPPTS
jgi:hypothetical protein